MDKSREEFETAIKNKFGDLIDYRVCENGDGEYLAWDMQVAWWGWQASRKALVVDLSGIHLLVCDESDVKKELRSVGITVKGEGDEQTNVLSPE